MDAANKKRITEAEECIRKADNHLKTSILKMKLKADYDSAAMEYERAAVCYKNANELQMSRDMYLKAAQMHTANRNLFHCAKCNENAAMISKEIGDSDGSVKYMELAADGYAESGSSDTSAMALSKAAAFLETCDPDKAIQICNKGLAMVQQTDRSRMAGEFLNRLTRLYLKLERYSDAIDAIDSEIEKYIEVKETGRVGQLTLALVLVQLARGDSIAASKSFQNSLKCDEFEFSEEARVCSSLITVYESGDNSAFQQLLQRPILRTMDNEYLRLMKKLKAPEVEGGTGAEGNADGELAGDDEDLK